MGSAEAWVTHLSAIFWSDPTAGNTELFEAHDRDNRLRPVPAVHPGLPGWREVLDEAVRRHAPAVRADPTFYGLAPAGEEMQALAAACSRCGVPLMMAVRLEDIRQRHPHDVASDLPASAIRALIRSDPALRLLITHADRDTIQQVHFGSTPDEALRVLWDICWIWGPPEDHLELLLETVGIERFTFGTGMPLRLPENTMAKLDLLNLDQESRQRIGGGNLRAFLGALAG
jgi:predicted TIM-barrel fold metal-dependent hydrolase